MIALSTCWQSTLAPSGRDLIAGLKAQGFTEIELEYRVTPAMYAELKPALAAGEIRPVSIHSYFPAPDVSPHPGGGIWSFSSEDANERQTAVSYTKQAIDIAGELGAKAVVVHCGQVTMDPRTEELKSLFDAGQIDAPAGKRVIDSIKIARKSKIRPALDRVLSCLEPLAQAARDKDVLLGLENRYYAHEIPNSHDLAELLSILNNSSVGYWHDVGHAAVQENLGLDSQASLLGRFRDRAIGVHLHDVRGHEDHLAPGAGEVDFSFIRENLPQDIIQVLEILPSVTPAQMRAGIDHLVKSGIS